MAIDEQELYKFMGMATNEFTNINSSISNLGERIGELEKNLYVTKSNGWKRPAVYMGGGGITAMGLIELIRVVFFRS